MSTLEVSLKLGYRTLPGTPEALQVSPPNHNSLCFKNHSYPNFYGSYFILLSPICVSLNTLVF